MDSSSGLRLRGLLLLLVLFALVWGSPSAAFAYGSVAPSEQPIYECSGAGVTPPFPRGTTAAAACQSTAGRGAASLPKTRSCGFFGDGTQSLTYAFGVVDGAMYLKVTAGTCSSDQSPGGTSNGYLLQPNYLGLFKSCPEGSQGLGGDPPTSCECMLNFKPEGGKCVRYDCPAKGSYSQQVSPDVKLPNAGDSFCSGGCTVTPSSWKVDQEGQVWGVWPMKSANQACGGKKDAGGVSLGDDKLPEAPVACPANQCPGSVNGTNVCVPCKSATAQGPSTSASGAQPGDPPKDPSDPDSAVKGSTTQTTCVGAVCTTVTTYYDGKGNEVGSKTEEQPETDYCQKNPSASQCKKDSFGGACEGGFTCEGDAVECALAKEVHSRNCQWFKEPSQAIVDAGDRALAGGVLPDGHPYKDAMNAGPTQFSLSNRLDFTDGLGGGCPTDTIVSAMGQTLVIPWSQYCTHMQMVGNVFVAVTLLICVFIVFKE